MQWHSKASRELRDVGSSQKWLLEQVRGDLVKTCLEILQKLTDVSFMRQASFLPTSSASLAGLTDNEIVFEDELAAKAGDFALSLCKHRLRRTLYLTSSWPHKFVMLLGTADEQRAVVDDFKATVAAYDALQVAAGSDAVALSVLSRSPLKLVSVQQVRLACEELGYTPHHEIAGLVGERFLTSMQSQAVEDMNNHMKNSRHSQWSGRFRRPETNLATSVRSKLLSNVHKFKPVPQVQMLPPGCQVLSKSDFQGNNSEPSMPLNLVSTYTQKASYFSPVAENVGTPAADAAVVKHLHQLRLFGDLDKLWAGFFCQASHNIAFRVKDVGDRFGPWYVGLYHFQGSAVLAWPVSLVTVGHQSLQYVEFGACDHPVLLVITDVAKVEAFTFAWRSWAWQVKHVGAAVGTMTPGIRGFKKAYTDLVLKIAARSGWWDLGRSILDTVAESFGTRISEAKNTFDVLYLLTRDVLKCGPDAALDLLQNRMSRMMISQMCSEELLAVDEAAQCLREEDRQDLHHDQKRVVEQAREHAEFRRNFREKRASVRTDGSKKKQDLIVWKGPAVLRDNIPQAEAKKYCPDGSFLWRARLSSSWQSRYSDLPVRSCRDSAWNGEQGALRECIRYAWQCFLDVRGYPTSACPVKGLFDGGTLIIPAGAAGSSSCPAAASK